MSKVEIVYKPLKGLCGFKGIEVLPLNIFNQGQFK
jgi:hypothetical protein